MDFRIDTLGKLANFKRTPQGGLDIPASLTRTGVLVYRKPDGSVQRELRLPEEVFQADSLASASGMPVTIGHPGLVRTDNWQRVSVGHVSDDSVKPNGKLLDARVKVQHGDAVAGVEKKELVELSCGYTCDVEHRSGEYQGEKFDAIQRNIRYNHLALLPEGGGRAGSECSLHMDGIDSNYTSCMTLEEATKELERVKGELAGANARADAADAKVKSIDIDALVADRLALVQDAQAIVSDPKVSFAGKTDREVMGIACAKAFPKLTLDSKASEEYLRGLFNAAVVTCKTSRANVSAGNVHVDAASAVEDKTAAARARNEERSRNAWKGSK